jgi:antitoxin FitA
VRATSRWPVASRFASWNDGDNEGVPTVTIDNVPQDVLRVHERRAADAGQSLEEYLLNLLAEQVGVPTLEEVLEGARARSAGSVSPSEAAGRLRAERDSRT